MFIYTFTLELRVSVCQMVKKKKKHTYPEQAHPLIILSVRVILGF